MLTDEMGFCNIATPNEYFANVQCLIRLQSKKKERKKEK